MGGGGGGGVPFHKVYYTMFVCILEGMCASPSVCTCACAMQTSIMNAPHIKLILKLNPQMHLNKLASIIYMVIKELTLLSILHVYVYTHLCFWKTCVHMNNITVLQNDIILQLHCSNNG